MAIVFLILIQAFLLSFFKVWSFFKELLVARFLVLAFFKEAAGFLKPMASCSFGCPSSSSTSSVLCFGPTFFLFQILGGEVSEGLQGLANSLGMPQESTETSLKVFFNFFLSGKSFFKVAAPWLKDFAPFFKVVGKFFKVEPLLLAAPWSFFKATLLLSEGWWSSPWAFFKALSESWGSSCWTFFKVSCTMLYSRPVKFTQSDWSPVPLLTLLTWYIKVPSRSALIWIQTEPLNLDVFRQGFFWSIWYRDCLSEPGWISADGTKSSNSFTIGSKLCKAFGSTALFRDKTSYPLRSVSKSSCLSRTLNSKPGST